MEGNFILVFEKQDSKEISFKKTPVRLGLAQQGNIEVELLVETSSLPKIVIKNAHFLSSMSGTDKE